MFHSKVLKNMTLISRMGFLMVLAVILSSFFFGSVIVYYSTHFIKENEVQYASHKLDLINKDIEGFLTILRQASISISKNYNLHGAVVNDQWESFQVSVGLGELLKNQLLTMDYLKEISILSVEEGPQQILKVTLRDGKPIFWDSSRFKTPEDILFFLRVGTSKDEELIVSMPEKINVNDDGQLDKLQIQLGIPIKAYNGKLLGSLIVKADITHWIHDLISNLNDNDRLFITDYNNKLLLDSHPKDSEGMTAFSIDEVLSQLENDSTLDLFSSQFVVDNQVFYLNDKKSNEYLNLYIVREIPNLSTMSLEIIRAELLVMLLATGLGGCAVLVLTRPFSRLIKIVDDVANGRQDPKVLKSQATTPEACILIDAMSVIEESIASKDRLIQQGDAQLSLAHFAENIGVWEWYGVNNGHECWSESMRSVLGLSENTSLDGLMLSDYILIDDLEAFFKARQHYYGKLEPFSLEIRIRNGKDYRYFRCTAKTVFDSKGCVESMIGVLVDIDDYMRAISAKTDFISTLNHELRTPMTSIIGSLNLLLAGKISKLDEKSKKMLSITQRNSERLLVLINDLLDIDNINNKTWINQKKYFDCHQMIQSVFEQMQKFADDRQVEILYDFDKMDCYLIQGDEDKVSQVLINLLSNAIKYSSLDSQVTVSVFRDGNDLFFNVKDKGCGVPDDFKDNAFLLFSQADASDTKTEGGTGLGLYIAKSIVDAHQGEIDFESDQNGSHFWFRLPVKNDVLAQQE